MIIPTHNIKTSLFSLVILASTFAASCKKFLEIEPPVTEIVSETVFSNDASALSAVRGIYNLMVDGGFASGYPGSMTIAGGVLSDELINYYFSLDEYYTNSLDPNSSSVKDDFWSKAYKVIYNSNSVVERLQNSLTISTSTKNQLIGEALFLRSFCNFYLVNLFGEVPLVLTTDYSTNRNISRSPVPLIYEQIIKDLTESERLLSEAYPSSEKVRVNRFTASALLSRVYLYQGEWQKADAAATSVINSGLYSLASIGDVFLRNSSEALWQLMPIVPGLNTYEGTYLIPGSVGEQAVFVSLSEPLVQSFDTSDARKAAWIRDTVIDGNPYSYAYKYKIGIAGEPTTEYSMVLRVAELYLIRAECRTYLSDFAGANDDINMIRNRAGLDDVNHGSVDALLSSIKEERRHEFFVEWGHRWLDIKRWDLADDILQPVKTHNWQSTDILFPVPQIEIDNDPELKQNEGYN